MHLIFHQREQSKRGAIDLSLSNEQDSLQDRSAEAGWQPDEIKTSAAKAHSVTLALSVRQ